MPKQINDHDLLIEIRVELKNFIEEFKNFRNDSVSRTIKLDTEKAETKDVIELQYKVSKDIENRVRILERGQWKTVGYAATITSTIFLLIQFLLYH